MSLNEWTYLTDLLAEVLGVFNDVQVSTDGKAVTHKLPVPSHRNPATITGTILVMCIE